MDIETESFSALEVIHLIDLHHTLIELVDLALEDLAALVLPKAGFAFGNLDKDWDVREIFFNVLFSRKIILGKLLDLHHRLLSDFFSYGSRSGSSGACQAAYGHKQADSGNLENKPIA